MGLRSTKRAGDASCGRASHDKKRKRSAEGDGGIRSIKLPLTFPFRPPIYLRDGQIDKNGGGMEAYIIVCYCEKR
jgi:hypothetical protein